MLESLDRSKSRLAAQDRARAALARHDRLYAFASGEAAERGADESLIERLETAGAKE